MNVEHIPAEDVDMLPCGADWQSRHLESEKRKAEIRDRIHKQAEQGQKTAKDYFRPAKPTPSIYDSDLKRVAVYARVSTSSEEQISSIENQTLYYTKKIAETENWNLQDIYSDEGKSGTSLRKRDAFKRMMRDAKDQKIGYQSSTVFQTIIPTAAAVLSEKRQILRLTQQEVADRAKITLRQYQRLESGERNILTSSFGLACRVIEALDMDVSKFYHGDYYLEEEVKTTRGKGIASRKKSSI